MSGTTWIKICFIKKIIKDKVYFSLRFQLQRDICCASKFFGVGGCVCVCISRLRNGIQLKKGDGNLPRMSWTAILVFGPCVEHLEL